MSERLPKRRNALGSPPAPQMYQEAQINQPSTFKYSTLESEIATEIYMSKELDKAIERFTRISCEILDNGLQTIDAINSSLGIIADAERYARNEMRAADFTHCNACQSGLVLFLNDTPHADTETLQSVTVTLWETCPTCIAEYTEYTESIPCKHGTRTWENCEKCLDDFADANEPEEVMLDAPSDWEVQNGI